MANLVIIGAGDQARVVLEALNGRKDIDVLGFLDDSLPKGTMRGGLPVLGGVTEIPEHADYYHIAIGNCFARSVIHSLIQAPARALAIIHPWAIIATSAMILPGAFIGPRAVLHCGAIAKAHSIVNTGSILEHDSILGDYSHLAPGAVTGGHVEIGRSTFIGLGSMIRDRIKIGDLSIVGMGSVVVSDVAAGMVVYGNPARVIRENEAC